MIIMQSFTVALWTYFWLVGKAGWASAWTYWYDRKDCQQVCFEMVDHKPFIKALTYVDCLENKLVTDEMTHMEKIRCVNNVKQNSKYYFQNDNYRCGNLRQSNRIQSPDKILNRYKKIWVQCDSMCGSVCYHDAILDSTPFIGPKGHITQSLGLDKLFSLGRARRYIKERNNIDKK